MANKKYVSLSKLQTFLDNLKSTFALSTHKHTTADLTDYAVDTALSSTSTNPVQNAVIDAEFEAVSTAMSILDAEVDTKATANHGIYYGTCDSAANAQIKTVTLKDATGFSLEEGAVVIVKFKYHNSIPNPQMKVGTTEPIDMKAYGSMPMSSSQATNGWSVGAVQIFVYDGINWVRDYWRNTQYVNEMLGHGYGTCDTEETTLEKVVVCSGYSISEGGFLSVRFANAVPAYSTLTIGNYTKEVYYNGELIPDRIIKAGETATFVYDGTVFHLIAVNRDTYSKSDHEWSIVYDSGEITEAANSIVANIDFSAYNNFQLVVYNVNDGTNTTATSGTVVFTAKNGTTYLINTWPSGFFSNTSGRNACGMAHYKILNGWLMLEHAVYTPGASKNIFDEAEGGTAVKCSASSGGAVMRCTNELATMAVTSQNQSTSNFFGVGSRVMIWGCKV